MNLEQIETSTTAGKAEVMRLAAEGRGVCERMNNPSSKWSATSFPTWDWRNCDYAIISEPVGPEEAWLIIDHSIAALTEESAKSYAEAHGLHVVRYIRADLAWEKG